MPAGLTVPIGNTRYDWCYASEPEPHMHNRRIFHGRGKVLGGSSSINGMIFSAATRWTTHAGPPTPAWQRGTTPHCLPYFKRMETCLAGGDDFRGDDGPLVLESAARRRLLFQAFFAAVQTGCRSPTTSTATVRKALPPSTAMSTAGVGG
ncbi:MAG: GMC family oxidoreductase N-terminal domain-containing protein [Caldilineaceae bacterium]